MDAPALWDQTLLMVSHAYFERKEKFEMNADSYPVWVLFAVETGKFRFRIGAERGEAGPGELIYCPPGLTFYREMVSPLGLHYIGFEFAGSPLPEPQPPSVLSLPADGKRLASNFAYLRKLHLAVDPRSALRKQMILNDIWQLSCEVWEGEHRQDELSRLADSEDALMNRAAEWLYRHAHSPFGMSELSHMLGLSPVQFTRRFRKSFRMTPSDFVRSLRIRKAAGLLLDTDLTLNQIASRCGFENGFYLSRVFAQSMGMSPSKYRELNRV
ncbi:AraC family transcriptional regulator [Paenibacillus sp. GD4]|jgi:AraC family transcriptional regulator|uniref:AraC family transcriptional regulator n=1 Tax=Paenibacillus sp. GD4 TaxID=3068890 RepID=UPI002796CB3B|nr:AraC family transcriptional regulator [Paenibacillus sp. GD4]MDQ1913949.1 AraC family transcriptional regulator [Paenibacillus sp. GD4]